VTNQLGLHTAFYELSKVVCVVLYNNNMKVEVHNRTKISKGRRINAFKVFYLKMSSFCTVLANRTLCFGPF
jgi:hypothetical protein